jgi:hypothetical protein
MWYDTKCLYLQGEVTLPCNYVTTRYHKLEESDLNLHRCENHKCHVTIIVFG